MHTCQSALTTSLLHQDPGIRADDMELPVFDRVSVLANAESGRVSSSACAKLSSKSSFFASSSSSLSLSSASLRFLSSSSSSCFASSSSFSATSSLWLLACLSGRGGCFRGSALSIYGCGCAGVGVWTPSGSSGRGSGAM